MEDRWGGIPRLTVLGTGVGQTFRLVYEGPWHEDGGYVVSDSVLSKRSNYLYFVWRKLKFPLATKLHDDCFQKDFVLTQSKAFHPLWEISCGWESPIRWNRPGIAKTGLKRCNSLVSACIPRGHYWKEKNQDFFPPWSKTISLWFISWVRFVGMPGWRYFDWNFLLSIAKPGWSTRPALLVRSNHGRRVFSFDGSRCFYHGNPNCKYNCFPREAIDFLRFFWMSRYFWYGMVMIRVVFFEAFGHRRLRRLCSFGERLQNRLNVTNPR